MTERSYVSLAVDPHGVARLTLTRPEKHNAFSDQVIAELHKAIAAVALDEGARVLVLAAEGKSFCAGADLDWMKAATSYTQAENEADANKLAAMLDALNTLSVPTVALVQGAAIAGGTGLVSCCDVVLAVHTAKFAVSEVRLGLIPATISPYVLAAIGARQARRYFLTGERFDALTAAQLGLVHEVVGDADALVARGDAVIAELLAGGPQALATTKTLIADVADRPITAELRADTARRIAKVRIGAEAQDGLASFFGKRPPMWRNDR